MNMKLCPIILILLCSSHLALAHIAFRGKQFEYGVTKAYQQNSVDKVNRPSDRQPNGKALSYIEAVIPLDLQATNELGVVRDRILRKTVNSILKSPIIRNSALMRTANKVKKSTQLDVKIKTGVSGNSTTPEVEHKFKFDLEAVRGQARLSYDGYINSKIEYRAQDACIEFSIEEEISDNSKLALTHLKDDLESRQLIQYQIQW